MTGQNWQLLLGEPQDRYRQLSETTIAQRGGGRFSVSARLPMSQRRTDGRATNQES